MHIPKQIAVTISFTRTHRECIVQYNRERLSVANTVHPATRKLNIVIILVHDRHYTLFHSTCTSWYYVTVQYRAREWLLHDTVQNQVRFGSCKIDKYTVQRETFEGENFREFHGSRLVRESFLREHRVRAQPVSGLQCESVKVFSAKSSCSSFRKSVLPRNFPAIRQSASHD